MSGFILNAKKSNKKDDMLSKLDEIDDIPLPSSLTKSEPKKEKKKKSKKVEIIDDEPNSTDIWLNRIKSFSDDKGSGKKNKKSKSKGFHIEDGVIKNKKKKKGKKGKSSTGLTDYNTQFAPEFSALHHLQKQQTDFVNSLQKKYDEMEKSKSSARGIGKFTTDLIQQINTGRSTALSISNSMISLKKTIADLSIKEKKEFGSKNDGQQDINAISGQYLQQLLNAGRQAINNPVEYEDADTYNSTYEELDSALSDILGDDDRDPDIDKLLEYERKNITIKLHYHTKTGEYEFFAYNDKGEIEYDYPEKQLPSKDTKLSINLSTLLASDEYSRKFPIVKIEEETE